MAAKRVYLHIGAPKTGTTYLQSLLNRNRAALADEGVLYPDFTGDAHHKAAWDLRGVPPQREGLRGVIGTWQRLVDEINAAPSDALLSSEHFVFAKQRDARRAVSAFEAEVHVLYTARDLVRQVPAVWQERIKNQQAMDFHEFVAGTMGGGGSGFKSFWRAQDAAQVLRTWSQGRDPALSHVVTAPPSGSPPSVLWDRFVSVLGLRGASFDTSEVGPANASLTMTQTELLRRFNDRFGADVPWVDYRRIIKGELKAALASIKDNRRISLTGEEHAFFAGEARRITETLRTAGYDVVGDLADLRPEADGLLPGQGPETLTDGELLSAALDVIYRLVDNQPGVTTVPGRTTKRQRGGAKLTDV